MSSSLEFNSFEHPSFEKVGGNFEGAKEPLPELREATPEQVQKAKEHNTLADRLYKKNSITEALIRSDFKERYDKHFDTIWRTGDIAFLTGDVMSYSNTIKENQKLPEAEKLRKEVNNQTEKQTRNPDTPEEKEKLTTYAELSDLAYVDFVTVHEGTDPLKTSKKISKVHLDPLAFPNFKMIAEGKIPEKPTEDERIIIAYLDKHKSNDRNHPTEQGILRARNDRENGKEISPDVADLLRIASLENKGQDRERNTENLHYASLDGKYQTTMIDANPNLPPTTLRFPNTDTVGERTSRMVDAMEHLRTIKEKQASNTLETITKEKGYTIVDYFPNEIKKDNTSSGFGAICLRDSKGNMSFAIRGTELADWGDIVADGRLVMKHVPENQTQDLITFFERNMENLKEGQKVNITGHSLGGALTQIASIMYAEIVNESYTFNSPGAKKLSINPEEKSDIIRQKFEKFRVFEYNRGNEGSVESRMTNVSGIKGPSIITNLGEDIGDYEIQLQKLESHSITEVIQYINGLKEGSPELVKRYVGKKEEQKKSKTTEQ